jgi:hypothetical protein
LKNIEIKSIILFLYRCFLTKQEFITEKEIEDILEKGKNKTEEQKNIIQTARWIDLYHKWYNKITPDLTKDELLEK